MTGRADSPGDPAGLEIDVTLLILGEIEELGFDSGGFAGASFWRAVGVPAPGRGCGTDTALEVLPRLIAIEESRLGGGMGQAAGLPTKPRGYSTRRKRMREELLASIEREVLGWPGVWKKRDEKGPGGLGVTGYRFGRRQIGHVHDNGHADFRFPREVRDDLIRSGRAIPHPAFPNSRTTASYQIRTPEDLPGAVELFRMNYERASQTLKRRGETAA